MDRKLIFVDTETTGLDPVLDNIVELSWAPISGGIKTLYFGIEEVEPFIDDLIKFTERGIAGMMSTESDFKEFLDITEGQTMVAANPRFDANFLENNGLFNFGHRMLDIETYAMAKLGLSYVPSMKEIHQLLMDRGFWLPLPNHTSAGDVAAMREMYLILSDDE